MDHTSKVSGVLTSDPVTLHIDCFGTVEAVRAPTKKTLGAGSERAHIWSRLLPYHDDMAAVRVNEAQRPLRQSNGVAEAGKNLADKYATMRG